MKWKTCKDFDDWYRRQFQLSQSQQTELSETPGWFEREKIRDHYHKEGLTFERSSWGKQWTKFDQFIMDLVRNLYLAGFYISSINQNFKLLVMHDGDLSQVEFFTRLHSVTDDVMNVKFRKNGAWVQISKPEVKE